MLRNVGLLVLLSAALVAAGPAPRQDVSHPFGTLADAPSVAPTPSSQPREAVPAGVIEVARAARPDVMIADGIACLKGHCYRAKLSYGQAKFVYGRGAEQRLLILSTTDVTAGGQSLLDPQQPLNARQDSADTVSWNRGAVVEIYQRRDHAMKQSYRIAQRPATAGDLVVRQGLTTSLEAPPDGFQGRTLTFRRGGIDAVAISDAVVIDAQNRRLPLDMLYAGGVIEMRVPQAWLDQAEFPIVVDPVVGGVILPDSVAVAGPQENDYPGGRYLPTPVDVAYNPTTDEYFYVWAEMYDNGIDAIYGNDDDDMDVWMCRLSAATGAIQPAGPAPNPQPLDWDFSQCGEIQTAFNTTLNQYLSVYRYNVIPAVATDASQIRGRVTNAAGDNAPAPSGFSTLNTGFIINSDQTGDSLEDEDCDVAAQGSQWFVVWGRHNAGFTTGLISGRLVTAPSTFNGASFTVEDNAAAVERRPAIAFNATSGNFLIAWDTTALTAGEVFARNATTAAPPVFGAVNAISTADPIGGGFADIGANTIDGEFVVVWQDDTSAAPANADPMGRRVASTGAPLAPVVTLVTGATFDGKPRVSYNAGSGSYLFAFHRINGAVTAGNIHAGRLCHDLSFVEAQAAVTAFAAEFAIWPAVVARPAATPEGMLAWLHVQGALALGTNAVPEGQRFGMPPGFPAVAGLIQSDLPAGPAAPLGFTDTDPNMSMRGTMTDPDAGQTVAIEVEVKANGVPFNGLGLITGPFVASGGVSEVTTGALANGGYHWRARALDSCGLRGPWVDFNAAPTDHFIIAVPGAGGGPIGRDNPNGKHWFNDTICGVAGSGGSLLWLALALAAALMLVVRR